jgi:nicotinate-nucleotide adenylyltransferase
MAGQRRQRIGILGGTFNPVHLGHLIIAQDALEQARLDRVVFVPSATPPHKSAPDLASAQHRWRMLKLALAGNPRFAASDIELRRGGKSYSVETVTELQRRHPAVEYLFIIGSDSVQELHKWKEADRLVRLCRFVVLARPGFKLTGPLAKRCRVVRGHECEIASREIRRRMRRGESIRYLVPDAVFRYIHARKLYL